MDGKYDEIDRGILYRIGYAPGLELKLLDNKAFLK